MYDNGGGYGRFCRKCLHFSDDEECQSKVPNPDHPERNVCGHPTVAVPEDAGTFDRYTVVFTGRYPGRPHTIAQYRGMSHNPTQPQGYGQWGEQATGFDCNEHGFSVKRGDLAPFGGGNRKFGGGNRRITFMRLPYECQQLIVRDYTDLWEL